MDLQTRKTAFVEEFLKVQSEEVVTRFEKLLIKEAKRSKGNEVEDMPKDELNKMIELSLLYNDHGTLTKNVEKLKDI